MMTFERIVVGVDFSSASLNAVRWVARNFAPSARVFVVHVVAEPRLPVFLRSAFTPEEDVETTLYPGLRAFAGIAGGDPGDAIVVRGNPSSELARLASELSADLVCVGRSQRRRGSGRFGATTPQRLLTQTSIPVLILPESARVLPDAVLAAISDGRDAADVIRAGSALARTWDVRLDALHALEPEVVAYAAGAAYAKGEAHLCSLAREWVATQATQARAETPVSAVARLGDAGEEVVAHAARAGIGLIVAGRRVERDGEDHLLVNGDVGSTTRLITWATSCPVLVLGCRARGSCIESPPPRGHGLSHPRIGFSVFAGARARRSWCQESPDGDDAA